MDRQKYIVSKSAIIGKNVEIMPGAVIGDNVIIGDNVRIFPYAVIGLEAQYSDHRRIDPSNKKVIIGSGTVLREFVTIHMPSDSTTTSVGENCYLMATSHVGHDCDIGSNVTLSNSANIAGHVKIGNNTSVGLNVSIHQGSDIGMCCMIGAQSFFKGNSPPGIIWVGIPARPIKVNTVGVKRAGLDRVKSEDIILTATKFIRAAV